MLETAVLTKWKYLRNKFTTELKKEKQVKSGMAAEEHYISTWHYMDEMRFLSDCVVTTKETLSNVSVSIATINNIVYRLIKYGYVLR